MMLTDEQVREIEVGLDKVVLRSHTQDLLNVKRLLADREALVAENKKLWRVVDALKRYRASIGDAAEQARQEVCAALAALEPKEADDD